MLSRIGEVEIWRIMETIGPFRPISQFFPDLSPDDLARHRHVVDPHGLHTDPETGEDWIVLPVQAFLLRTPHHLVLLDACVGNEKTLPSLPSWSGMRSNRFLSALRAAGAQPEDVTHVMCTHLHVDHVGWTTVLRDGTWVPTFPNAKVMSTQADLDHARTQAQRHPEGSAGPVWRETLGPLVEGGMFETVAPDHRIGDSIRLVSTPGHTPGHVAVEIAVNDTAGLAITGDLIHSPLQCPLPDLSPSVDWNAKQAAQTRRTFLDARAGTGQLIIGSHFPLPSLGTVEHADEAFRWCPSC
ncbi:MAG: MBL fold metallo-hydrolase [Pseudomonadota bacterium]